MGREAEKPADGAAVLSVYLRPEGRKLSALEVFLVAGTAVQHIIARIAGKGVIAQTTGQAVCAIPAVKRVI